MEVAIFFRLRKLQLEDVKAACFMSQVFSAVSFVHSCDVVHCDVKPENVLLKPVKSGSSFSLKLADFGLACRCETTSWLQGNRGTVFYKSPELLQGYFNRLCDVWACGCVLYEFLRGGRLLAEENCSGDAAALVFLRSKHFYDCVMVPVGKYRQGSPALESLLRSMLRFDVSSRLLASEALALCREFCGCRRRWSSVGEVESSVDVEETVMDGGDSSVEGVGDRRSGVLPGASSAECVGPVEERGERVSSIASLASVCHSPALHLFLNLW